MIVDVVFSAHSFKEASDHSSCIMFEGDFNDQKIAASLKFQILLHWHFFSPMNNTIQIKANCYCLEAVVASAKTIGPELVCLLMCHIVSDLSLGQMKC